MAGPASPARDYTVRQAAALLGLTEDAIRKRVVAGRLDGRVDDGMFLVAAEAVESARRELLERLNAVDARGEVAALYAPKEELERLREEVVRAKGALQSMIQAQASLNDTLKMQLDAIQQLTLPGSPRSLMGAGNLTISE
jgi:hypothetical protein